VVPYQQIRFVVSHSDLSNTDVGGPKNWPNIPIGEIKLSTVWKVLASPINVHDLS